MVCVCLCHVILGYRYKTLASPRTPLPSHNSFATTLITTQLYHIPTNTMCPRNFLPQALAALLRSSSTSTPSSVAAAFSPPSSHLSKRHNNFGLGYRKYSSLDTDIIVDATDNTNSIINRPSLEEIESCKSFDSFGDILPISNQEKKDTSFDTTTSKLTQEGGIWSSHTKKKKDSEKDTEDNEQQYDTAINLFGFEENTDAFAAGISSLTWFEGDANSAVEVIRPRIKEILHANPWLLGSLRGSSPMRLEYNANIEPTTSDIDTVFQFFSLQDTSSLPDVTGKLKYGMHLTELNQVTQLYDLVLEPSKHLVNTNKPLFKISLIPESNEFKRFALVVSLSHRIADGATFYNLYQMLDPTSEIHTIDPTRKLDVLESIDNLTGKNKDEEGITGTYFKLLFVRDKMRSLLRKSIGLSEGRPFNNVPSYLIRIISITPRPNMIHPSVNSTVLSSLQMMLSPRLVSTLQSQIKLTSTSEPCLSTSKGKYLI